MGGVPQQWALIAFAVVSAAGGGWRALARGAGPGPVAVWVRDRAAHVDFGLDGDAIVVARRPHVGVLEPTSPAALPSELGVQLAAGHVKWIAAALDHSGWDRARPGGWLLVGGPTGNPRRAMVDAGEFLERWVLTGSPPCWQRAFRLRLPWEARALASCESGVWVGAARRCALRFFAHDGALRVDEELLDADGIEALTLAPYGGGGGVWAAAGGAVVRLAKDGRRLPGQGGFAQLVAIETASAISRSR